MCKHALSRRVESSLKNSRSALIRSRASSGVIEALERRQLLSVSFAPAQTIGKVGDVTFPTTSALADYDLDGDIDVAAHGEDRLAWFRNNGNGTFQPMKTITTDVGPWPMGCVIPADVNGDGRSDLVASYYEYPVEDSYAKSRVAWYEYQPKTGAWTEHIVTDGSIGGLTALAAGDIDRDGDMDVVATNYRFEESIKVVWFQNNGKGLSWKARTICDDEAIGTGSQSITLLDANKDGWLDAAVGARFSSTVTLYRSPASKQNVVKQWKATVLDDNMPEMAGMASGDLNGDGFADIVALSGNPYDPVGDSNPRVAWYRNNSAHPGQFGPAISLAKAGDYQRPYYAQPVDLDRDGDLDLLVGCVDHVDWFENLGSGVFSAPKNIGTDADADSEAVDINGDGRLDVVSVVAPANRIVWYRNISGTGSISGRVFNDLDEDGRLDSGEPGLKGRTLYIDLDNDKQQDAGEPSALTNASGKYTIKNLAAGSYNIRQVLPAGWTQSTPRNSHGFKVTLAEGQNFNSVLHGSYLNLGSISGRLFNDLDRDGRLDSGEAGLKGRTLYIDLDDDMTRDANEPAAVTNSNGWYTIKNLPAGYYNVRQILPAGWIQSTPKNGYGYKVNLLAGQSIYSVLHGAYLGESPQVSFSINLRSGVAGAIPASMAPFVSFASAPEETTGDSYYETVLRVNLNDPARKNPFKSAVFSIHYDTEPTGTTVDIGDSDTNDGFGGDAGTQNNDAEINIGWVDVDPPGAYRQLLLLGKDGAPEPVLRQVNNFAAKGYTLDLTVANQRFAYNNHHGLSGSLPSPYLYALNGQPDGEGPVNYDIFAAFNRVVAGTYRPGTGVDRVTVTLLK